MKLISTQLSLEKLKLVHWHRSIITVSWTDYALLFQFRQCTIALQWNNNDRTVCLYTKWCCNVIRKKSELWNCFKRVGILLKLWNEFSWVKCAKWFELLNNVYIYFTWYSDCVTSSSRLIDILRFNTGCNDFTTSLLLEASCTLNSDIKFKGVNLLTQNYTSVSVVKIWVWSLMLVSCV